MNFQFQHAQWFTQQLVDCELLEWTCDSKLVVVIGSWGPINDRMIKTISFLASPIARLPSKPWVISWKMVWEYFSKLNHPDKYHTSYSIVHLSSAKICLSTNNRNRSKACHVPSNEMVSTESVVSWYLYETAMPFSKEYSGFLGSYLMLE